ncbi:hypothetical protein GEMRC1_009477 [Eukaryota sp. GEM-RC1]
MNTIHRSILFSSDDFWQKTAIDYDARIIYLSEGGVQDLAKLNDKMFFSKTVDNDACVAQKSEELTILMDRIFLVLLPPKAAKKDGSKTVNGVTCVIYKATFTLDGDLEWCITEGFVIVIDSDIEDREPAVLTDHQKLDKDSKYIDESNFCHLIEFIESETSNTNSSVQTIISIGPLF